MLRTILIAAVASFAVISSCAAYTEQRITVTAPTEQCLPNRPCPTPAPNAPNDVGQSSQILDVLKALLTGQDRLSQAIERLNSALYYQGVKDGALGCGLCLVIVYLLFIHKKQQQP
jgi:hypothetical protein